jgi:hypothetical protein
MANALFSLLLAPTYEIVVDVETKFNLKTKYLVFLSIAPITLSAESRVRLDG